MTIEPLYSDSLVILTEDAIIFKHYYYPTRAPKRVAFADIKQIVVKKPTIWNGKWRLHGTGTFTTWFPEDQKRPTRDMIFFAKLRKQWVKIAFTVEDSKRVEEILREKKLII
jgi:hypothetical protein